MLHRIDSRRGWPLYDAPVCRAIEAAALQNQTTPLMQRAGASLAGWAQSLYPLARQWFVLCGGGHNGGDGLVAAARLAERGGSVRIALLARSELLPPDCATALQHAQQSGATLSQSLAAEMPGAGAVILDALFGLGGHRALSGVHAEAARWANAARARGAALLAVDQPSGLDSESGAALGDAVIEADATLCFLALRPGLFTGAGRAHCGEIWFEDLDIAPNAEPRAATLISEEKARSGLRARRSDAHKGTQGDVTILGGAPGMLGAAVLAARMALWGGAGRVFVAALSDGVPLDWNAPELQWRRPDQRDWSRGVTVAGCGGGGAIAEFLPSVIEQSPLLVLDADALNCIAAHADLHAQLLQRSRRALPAAILTPHPLEAARLLGSDTQRVQADRLRAAQEISTRLQSIVLLKGSGTIIAAPSQTPAINFTGNAALASAGSGDVLSGLIGALWAANPAASAFDIAAAAAWFHGAAAENWRSAPALPASELIRRIAAVLAGPSLISENAAARPSLRLRR